MATITRDEWRKRMLQFEDLKRFMEKVSGSIELPQGPPPEQSIWEFLRTEPPHVFDCNCQRSDDQEPEDPRCHYYRKALRVSIQRESLKVRKAMTP